MEVYLIEDYGDLSERVTGLRRRMLRRNDQLYTSTLTRGEILVKPVEAGNEALCRRYEAAISAGCVLVPFGAEAARRYAAIRRDREIRPPDAIQLACAAQARVDLFITNDDRLSDKSIPGIEFVSSLARAFL
jgi:predicted nucleic acid-binding protein